MYKAQMRKETSIQIHLMLLFIVPSCMFSVIYPLFKYISCYCLSQSNIYPRLFIADSNTSHVIVYRGSLTKGVTVPLDSNTSHVIVYRNWPQHWCGPGRFKYISCYCLSRSHSAFASCAAIQIHLMLLFIMNELANMVNDYIFKYISCYCLSPWSPC